MAVRLFDRVLYVVCPSDPSRFEANLLSIEVNPVRSERDQQGFEVELPGIESSHRRPEMEWFRAQVDRETRLEWLVAWEEVDASWRAKDEPANLASPIDLEGILFDKRPVPWSGTENQVQNVLFAVP